MSNSEFFTRELELEDGRPLTIKQRAVGNTAAVVWDGALAFCAHAQRIWTTDETNGSEGKRVLELGSGTGVCSIVMATMGAKCTATDLNCALDLIAMNVESNRRWFEPSGGEVTVQEFDWSDASARESIKQKNFDTIILVDCIYYIEGVRALVDTLNAVATSETEVICVFEERTIGQPEKAQKLFMDLIRRTFTVTDVPECSLDRNYICTDIKVLTLKRSNHLV